MNYKHIYTDTKSDNEYRIFEMETTDVKPPTKNQQKQLKKKKTEIQNHKRKQPKSSQPNN